MREIESASHHSMLKCMCQADDAAMKFDTVMSTAREVHALIKDVVVHFSSRFVLPACAARSLLFFFPKKAL